MSYEYECGDVSVTLDDEGHVEEILMWVPAIGRHLDVTNMSSTFPEIAEFEARALKQWRQENPAQDLLDMIAEDHIRAIRNGDDV